MILQFASKMHVFLISFFCVFALHNLAIQKVFAKDEMSVCEVMCDEVAEYNCGEGTQLDDYCDPVADGKKIYTSRIASCTGSYTNTVDASMDCNAIAEREGENVMICKSPTNNRWYVCNQSSMSYESADPDNHGGTDIPCPDVCAAEGGNAGVCESCMCSGNDYSGNLWTEIGCITPTQKGLVAAVLRIFIGIITAIVVIRFIQAGMLFNTDDPDKISEAKSIATSAVIALIFGAMIPIILNFIGVDILNLGQIIGIS